MRPPDFSLTRSAQRCADSPHGNGAPSTVETLYSGFSASAAGAAPGRPASSKARPASAGNESFLTTILRVAAVGAAVVALRNGATRRQSRTLHTAPGWRKSVSANSGLGAEAAVQDAALGSPARQLVRRRTASSSVPVVLAKQNRMWLFTSRAP